ncbi:putative Ras-related protein Rab-28 [Hypsibius exemplaris]|uniref:Ras-related protein Rab-28 n=1 Tax=Hypsibius exemplaris TaxID=2072580 RepID=A0A1W0WJG8_HYPEX|nr:putative Ras-related protein Rab-28 [Hypsibius exemplaris]
MVDHDPDQLAAQHESVLKFVILGEAGVGKTSIIHRFLNDRFSTDSIQTSGVEFHRKRISFPGHIDVSLHVWDTGGNALASPMLSSYLHEAHVLLFLYDITNTASFSRLSEWFAIVRKAICEPETPGTATAASAYGGVLSDTASRKTKEPYMALIGNKSDMQHIRTIKSEKANKLAQENGVAEISIVSAQSGDGVHALFRKITATVLGLRLGRADFEQDIVAADVKREVKDGKPLAEKPPMNRTRSTVCLIN